MKKVFAARNQNGKIIFVGTGNEETVRNLTKLRLAILSRLAKLKEHL